MAVVIRGPCLKHSDSFRKRLLTSRHVIRSIVRDQRSGSVPHGCRGRCRGPVSRSPSQDFCVEQLKQLVADIGVHPAVDNRV